MQKVLIAITVAVLMAGCSGFPGVYKIDIPQGNVVTQKMVDQLRPGMTPSQVRFVMGTPLVTDYFHKNRWDYIYSKKTGKDGSYVREQLTLYFKNGKLDGMSGDYRPGGDRKSAIESEQ